MPFIKHVTLISSIKQTAPITARINPIAVEKSAITLLNLFVPTNPAPNAVNFSKQYWTAVCKNG